MLKEMNADLIVSCPHRLSQLLLLLLFLQFASAQLETARKTSLFASDTLSSPAEGEKKTNEKLEVAKKKKKKEKKKRKRKKEKKLTGEKTCSPGKSASSRMYKKAAARGIQSVSEKIAEQKMTKKFSRPAQSPLVKRV